MRLSRAARAIGMGLTGLFAGSLAKGASADPLPLSAEHIDSPGRDVASEDSSQAIVLNPANLAWMPAPELRWMWIACQDTTAKVGCGHAWEGATPLPFGLATGLRVDLVQPPWGGASDGVPFPYRGFDYVWLTWALAIRLGERASFGMSIQRTYSQNPYIDGLFGISAGLSWRPNSHFGFSAVAHDFNRPAPGIFPAIPGTNAINPAPVLDGRYTLAMAFRPTGRRDIDVGLELDYRQGNDDTDVWTERATLGVDVPFFGRAIAGVEVANLANDTRRGVVGTLGVEAHFKGLSAGGGALFGSGLGGGDGSVAGYGTISVAGYTQPGLPRPERAVWMRIESTPSTREHVALLRRLWGLARQRDVAEVSLILRDEPASSFAHAEELADAIRVLRAHGKKVLCSWEVAGPKALYTCASADRIVLTPSGGVNYAGLKAQYVYLKGLLDKIGVKAEFVRVGPHKTAPEQFTNEHAGPVASEDHVDMLRQQEAVFVRNLSLYRHMSEERIRAVTRTGPFFGTEARDAGFVDGFVFDDELERAARELVGHEVTYAKYDDETKAERVFGARGKVALLYLDGNIIDGRSQHIPLVDIKLVGSYSMQDSIRELRDDATVRAVVLRIESPGGSSLASDVMWRELTLLGRKKPLIVSMGSVAASGGYYVAAASRDVYALPLTITGSIGVFYGKADVSGLLSKIGVTVDTYKTAPRADGESMFRGFTADESKELEHKVGQFYDVFLDRVSQGRGMRKEDVDAVGRGRVWTGQQAFDRHLVDHLGGLREALDAARAAALLPPDAPIVEKPSEAPSLVEKLLSAAVSPNDAEAATIDALPAAVRGLARSIAPLVVYRSDEPLARMEWVDAEDEPLP